MATTPSLTIEQLSAEIDRLKAAAGADPLQPPPVQTQPLPAPTFAPYTAPDGSVINSPEQMSNYIWQKEQQVAEAARIAAEATSRAQSVPQPTNLPRADSTAEEWAQMLVSKGPKVAVSQALDEALGIKDSISVIRAMAGATLEAGQGLTALRAEMYKNQREAAAGEFVNNYADAWDGSGDNPAKLYRIVEALGLKDNSPASYEAAFHYGRAQGVFPNPQAQQQFSAPGYQGAAPPRIGRAGMSQQESSVLDRAEELSPEQLRQLIVQYGGR